MKLRWLRSVRLGWKSLLRHKLRSGLAVLGIIFGVCSVIAMLAIGEGASYEVQEQIKRLGATNIIIRSIKPAQASDTGSTGEGRVLEYGLRDEDHDRLRATVPTISEILPVHEMPQPIRYRQRSLDGRMVATTAAYQRINNVRMHRGRFLTDVDSERRGTVAVLAYEAAQSLIPIGDPLGQTIRIHTDYFRVVGVCAPRAPSGSVGGSLAGQEYSRDVYIPITTARLRFGELHAEIRGSGQSFEKTQLSQMTLLVGGVDQVLPTAGVVRDLLAQHHKKSDYGVTVPQELLDQAERTRRLFNVVLGSVGGISLLVGGIGIMNIMLATVTERTREIGVRRALGARRRDITSQFLVEAVVLTSVGGLLGVALGVGVAYLVERAAALLGMPLTASVTFAGQEVKTRWVIAAVVGLALLVGVAVLLAMECKRHGFRWMLLVNGLAGCVTAAAAGLFLGVGLPYMITDLVSYFFEYRVPTIVNPWSLPLALGIAVATGVIFGLYPARRAALMDPIEALRHE